MEGLNQEIKFLKEKLEEIEDYDCGEWNMYGVVKRRKKEYEARFNKKW